MSERLHRATPLTLFVLVFAVHVSGLVTSYDSRWTVPTARSLLREGNADLDEYRHLLEAHRYYAVELVGGRHYSIFPIGPSLLALPAVLVVDATGWRLTDGKVEKLVASLTTAGTAALLYLLARGALGPRAGLVPPLVFAFCTAAWSTASRGLWQHGPSMLMLTLTLTLWLLVRGERRPSLIALAGLPLAFSFVVRPTNAISVALLGAFVLWRHPRHVARHALSMLLVALPFLLFSLSVYDRLLPPYYASAGRAQGAALLEAMAGNLVSPGRGLFVFSPVLVGALWGAYLSVRRPGAWLSRSVAAIVVLHWLAISCCSPTAPRWHGGHSFGYRLFSDMLPYLVYLGTPAVAAVRALRPRRRAAVVGALVALAAVSAFVNFRGATSLRVYEWNSVPVDVDVAPERVWDWRDLQFLRGLRPRRAERPGRSASVRRAGGA